LTPAELRSLPASEAATLLHALWLDAHGDWSAAHSLIDELDTVITVNSVHAERR